MLTAAAILKTARRIARLEARLKREDARIIRGFKTEVIGEMVETGEDDE